MSYPGYPSSQPNYPPYPGGNPGAIGFGAPQAAAYPGAPSYPAYPSAGGYPGQQPGGYPPGPAGYPPQPGYPSPSPYGGSPYPSPYPESGGYPPTAPGYPPHGGGYPPQAGGYPPQGGYPGGAGYPPGPAGYPPAPSGYPGQPGYGTTTTTTTMEMMGQYPGQSAGYPGQPSPYQSQPALYASAPGPYPGAGPAPGYPSLTAEVVVVEEVRVETVHAGAPELHELTKEVHEGNVELDHDNEGTVKPHHPFNPEEDATTLKKAFKGFGTKEKLVIGILCNRTFAERAKIAMTYKTLFGKDLESKLKSETSGNFKDTMCELLMAREYFLAYQMHHAMCGMGTIEKSLIEVLCTSSNSEIHHINAAYKEKYNHSLENDIKGDTSGYFKRLLVAMNVGNRDESAHVDHGKAVADAQALYAAGEKQWGTNESVFNTILVARSFPHLRVVFEEYNKIAHHSIEEGLKKEMSGDLLDGLLSIVKCIRNKTEFFAERLNSFMKGMGTSDHSLRRIIISRSEIDLKSIKNAFSRMYGKSLESKVKSDTDGDYEKALLEIMKD